MAGPTTWNDLIIQINAILDNFAETVGEDVVSSNVTGATDFTKATGAYVNAPRDPWTNGTIPLNVSGIVKGGISVIWYKGPVLTKSSFTGGVITMFSGKNILNVLCRVFIDYDKGSGAFSVNIQTGFTGDLPSGPGAATATAPTITVTEAAPVTPSATAPTITVTE